MKAYYDSLTVTNLSHISDIIFDTPAFKGELVNVGFRVVTSDNYNALGIYLVSVKYDVNCWTVDCPADSQINIFNLIPDKVITALQNKKLILVIEAQSEGNSFIIKNVDGYKNIHDNMDRLGIPPGSVIIMSGNKLLDIEYKQWMADHNTKQYFHHVYSNTWDDCIRVKLPETLLIHQSMANKDSKDFNSLNRTPRLHRLAHLYKMAMEPDVYFNNGLISGYCQSVYGPRQLLKPNPIVGDVWWEDYADVLYNNYPKEVDGPFIELNPDDFFDNIYNHDIYTNSLLTFVTESLYTEYGIFFTEKVWKAIAAGHPFIVLGQYKYLEHLREIGYRTDIAGINHSYDDIKDPVDRVNAVQAELRRWIDTPRKTKEQLILDSMEALEHNFNLFNQSNYWKDSFKELYKVALEAGNKL